MSDAALARMRNAAEETRDFLKDKVSKGFPPSGPPGGYPARRTGRFRASIHYRVIRERGAVRILSNVPYAPHLEFGTRFSAPRPAFRLALRKFKERLQRSTRRRGSASVR